MTVNGFPCDDILPADHSCVPYALLTQTKALLLLSMVSSSLLMGCGAAPTGPDRFPINGTVTREGIPIDDGTVMFSPTVGGPAVSGLIIKGEYKFSEQDGVPAGKYKVNIMAKPLRDPTYVGKKNDATVLKDDRFKKEAPPKGWDQEAEVSSSTTKLDFAVDP